MNVSVSASSMRQDGLLDIARGIRPYANNSAYGFWPAVAYESDGIAAVIVDRPAEDALSRGFNIEGDETETVLNEMDRLDASIHLTDAIRWARLNGSSAILVLCQDGATLDQPLIPENIRQIDDLVVYSGDEISPEGMRYADPTLVNYNSPVYYRLSPASGGSFVVHESRLIKFTGDPVPRSRRFNLMYPWAGRSVLIACQEDLARYRAGLTLARQIMERKQQAVHAMAGLSELLGTLEGQDIVRQKIALTDAVRGLMNGITIDNGPGNGVGDGDDYKIIDLSLGGIDAVIGEFRDALSASSRMTQVVLFGSDIKGLGSTGTGEQSVYHALVRSIQDGKLRPAMEQLAGLIWAQRSVTEKEPEKWRVNFNPLFSPSEKEMADAENVRATSRKTDAEAITILMDAYVISPEEGRVGATKLYPEMELERGSAPEPPMPDEPEEGDDVQRNL